MQSRIQSFWADRYIHQTLEGTIIVGVDRVNFKICTCKCSKNALAGRLFLDFFVKYSENCLTLHYETLLRGQSFKKFYNQMKNLYGCKLVRAAKRSELERRSK